MQYIKNIIKYYFPSNLQYKNFPFKNYKFYLSKIVILFIFQLFQIKKYFYLFQKKNVLYVFFQFQKNYSKYNLVISKRNPLFFCQNIRQNLIYLPINWHYFL